MNHAAKTALLLATLPLSALADVQLSPLFSDHMVIQRDTEAPVWGNGDAGEKVTVTASWGETASTTVTAEGKWKLALKTPQAGGPHSLTVQGKNSIEIKDVLSGEVWFCSGQSNMDFSLKQLTRISKNTAKEDEPLAVYIQKEIATAEDSQLRQFEVTKNTSPFKSTDSLKGEWVASAPATNANFTGTGYFFARELRQKLKVPVGLIKCAWGGTRVEPWIPEEYFAADEEMKTYLQQNKSDHEKKLAKWDPTKAKQQYEAALKRWNETKKGRRPRGPAGSPALNQQMPTTLFNGMVQPVIPYAIKGAIWYQGESNTGHNLYKYEHNFETMISAWRKEWGQGAFPFYFVQLASFRAPVTEPLDHDSWASICDQQRRALSLENTGMAVLNDIGEAKDIHPHNKMDVGKRLALWALKNDYGQDLPVCSGPLYKSHEIKGDKVILTFDSVGSGLMTGSKTGQEATTPSTDPLKGFQICGKDREWKWAEASINADRSITVSHPDVKAPTVVRYAWASNPKGANLYNKEGLPASLFTTESDIPKAK